MSHLTTDVLFLSRSNREAVRQTGAVYPHQFIRRMRLAGAPVTADPLLPENVKSILLQPLFDSLHLRRRDRQEEPLTLTLGFPEGTLGSCHLGVLEHLVRLF